MVYGDQSLSAIWAGPSASTVWLGVTTGAGLTLRTCSFTAV